MRERRKYHRVNLITDALVSAEQDRPSHFGARMLNASPGGAALHSKHRFITGEIVSIEVHLPLPEGGMRGVLLHSVVRRSVRRRGRYEVGVEFVPGPEVGDYEWFADYLASTSEGVRSSGRRSA